MSSQTRPGGGGGPMAVFRREGDSAILPVLGRLRRDAMRVGRKSLQLSAQVKRPMKILLTGLNHETAPVELREGLAPWLRPSGTNSHQNSCNLWE